MSVNIGQLYRKRTVRKLDGSIVDMTDEANGGAIISKGRVVNQERVDELAKLEEDRRIAGQAQANQVVAPAHVAEDRTTAPSKVAELEKKVESMSGDIAAILKLLQK